MIMKEKLSHFLEHYGSPFIVGSLVTGEMIFINKVAEKMFGITKDDCDLGQVFNKTQVRIESLMRKSLHPDHSTLVYNYFAYTKERKKILVDLQVGYFNDEKTEIFLEIIPQHDNRMQMALHQIENSTRPEAILNFDDKLSIVQCNQPFHEVFESSEELRYSHFKNDLINGFLPEIREKLISDIYTTLSDTNTYKTKIQVFTATGEERWYLMELERRNLDNSGTDKIMVHMTNIEKQVEIEEEHSLMQQYLSAMQELTENVLYRVDVKTRVLTHTVDSPLGKKLGEQISDYADIFIQKKVIHPDDTERYLDYLQAFYSDNEKQKEECIIRLALFSDEYQWYNIKGKKIFDKDGNLVEVLGAMINIDEKQMIKEEFSALNQYFKAMQSLSDDILFHIDIEKGIFTHTDEQAFNIGLSAQTEDFNEVLIAKGIFHPDDVALYRNYVEEIMSGKRTSYEIRCAVDVAVYEWFDIRCEFIKDSQGKVVEIFGRSKNIHKEKEMIEDFSIVNQYFAAMQEFTPDKLFHVDIASKTFHHNNTNTLNYGIPLAIPDFPTTMVEENMIHPDHVEQFLVDVEEGVTFW